MKRALIVSGSGRYADPWHPFARTSARIAGILRETGFDVTVDDEVDAALAGLEDASRDQPGLVVVNVGNPKENHPADAGVRAGLLAHLGRGGGLLGVHVSATSFPGVPEWEQMLGGIWVRGTTMHPEYSRARIRVYSDRHPIVAGIGDFAVDDERYSYLRVDPAMVTLASHEYDGLEHPLLWAHRFGGGRVVYDALGHDAASYDAPEHRAIVAAAARWLTER
jgi:type 1 glutamine amidotransferase